MSLENREVVLTGATGGLGRLVGAGLAAAGARVTPVDRSGDAGSLAFDLSSGEGQEAAAEALAARRCDILVNLAGIQHFGPVESQSAADLRASYMVNLVAPVRLTQAVLPGMKARGAGQIVNVGSIFGSIGFAHFATYSSAKAGLRGFSQALRRELAGSGVDVTYVAPRAVRTAFNSPAVLEFARQTGMRMDQPEAVADRIVRAIVARERDVYLGFPESFFVRLNALLPRLVDQALAANDRKAARLFAR